MALGLGLCLACPLTAGAQPGTPPPPAAGAQRGFLTAYRGRIGAARFTVDDEQFNWEGRFAGDVDLVEYGSGRVVFAAEYAVVLGRERRSFDPTQGLYALDVRATRRIASTELGVVFHHVSRHLSDREKAEAVDWNIVRAEVVSRMDRGGFRLEGWLDGGGFIKRSYVDYTWQARGGARLARDVAPGVSLIGAGMLDVISTDADVAGRSTQVGAYAEGGVRLAGGAAALELFAAFERRVDPDPIVRGVRSWGLLGFRLVNR